MRLSSKHCPEGACRDNPVPFRARLYPLIGKIDIVL